MVVTPVQVVEFIESFVDRVVAASFRFPGPRGARLERRLLWFWQFDCSTVVSDHNESGVLNFPRASTGETLDRSFEIAG